MFLYQFLFFVFNVITIIVIQVMHGSDIIKNMNNAINSDQKSIYSNENNFNFRALTDFFFNVNIKDFLILFYSDSDIKKNNIMIQCITGVSIEKLRKLLDNYIKSIEDNTSKKKPI